MIRYYTSALLIDGFHCCCCRHLSFCFDATGQLLVSRRWDIFNRRISAVIADVVVTVKMWSRRHCLRMIDISSCKTLLRSTASTAKNFRECPFEFAAGAGVDERIQAAVAIAQPKTTGKQRRWDVASWTQSLCIDTKKQNNIDWSVLRTTDWLTFEIHLLCNE